MSSLVCVEASTPTPHFFLPTPIANYNNVNSVRVNNISDTARPHDVVTIFSTLIGDIRTFETRSDSTGTYLEISFNNQDTLKKALCMNGYNLTGTSLSVTPLESRPSPKPCVQSGLLQVDDRRNLYVLGLPFNLTKHEFSARFSQYGMVAHCVILATVDNSSRRRGFVVMSTHEEAKRAMVNLTGTQFKGYMLDVSWAVVQRSKGFLDGGDRSMVIDSRHPYVPVPMKCPSSFSEFQEPFIGAEDSSLASVVRSPVPTTSLLVSGLPSLLFGQKQDLSPLFYPFGDVKKLEVLATSESGILSIFVEYVSELSAQEAKDSLHGQIYGDSAVGVFFVEATYSDSSFGFTPACRSATTPLGQKNINASHYRPGPQLRSFPSSHIFDLENENVFPRYNSFPSFQSRYRPTILNSSFDPYSFTSSKRSRYGNLRSSAEPFLAFRTFSDHGTQFGQMRGSHKVKQRNFSA